MDQLAYLPPEWGRCSTLWVGWPTRPAEWEQSFEAACHQIAAFIKVAAQSVPVKVLAGNMIAQAAAEAAVGAVAEVHQGAMGDIWLRDTGPIVGVTAAGRRCALSFQFNGWGGKFNIPGDTETADWLTTFEGFAHHRHGFILEGGALDHDGTGHGLTTRQCLLNPNRNAGWTKEDAERALKAAFPIRQVTWLQRGLLGDHTDGHIDNLARFIGPGHVVCQHAAGEGDPNAEIYAEIETTLRAGGLRVDTITSPGRVNGADGAVLPASHMNFVFANRQVLLPVYDNAASEIATRELAALLPDHKIIPLPARAILTGGGAFHCMTCHIPAPMKGPVP